FFDIINQDPVISQVKLIAEPWDVGEGGYHVGKFPPLWAEWNGRYRDTVRQFWRGDRGLKGDFATRIAGSSDLYERSGRRPFASVNFVTAHDGFTLHDLVSYNEKRNEANGEDNRDGHEPNYSVNCGAEGPSDDPEVLECRARLKRALMGTLLLSQGVPMLLGGDELSKTQEGNNNAYAQDNALNWYDWGLDDREEAFLDFVREAIAFRRAHPSFRRRHFLTGRPDEDGVKDGLWWHPEGREMTPADWDQNGLRAFGFLLRGDRIRGVNARGQRVMDDTFLLLFNKDTEPVDLVLPEAEAGHPKRWAPVSPFDDLPTCPLTPDEPVALPPGTLCVLRAVWA
ncbi:MAG TPA: glycogen debranching enzyme GlgX, partial [Anaeromyxobacteraceae bacterium]|nr:glycogen debranching enzyme GlgX [Anaeromyxobacteraceae bacterium]